MTTLVYKTTAFPPAILGVPYEAGVAMALAAAGTLSGLAVSTGALPGGITVSSTTDPRLIGTPTATGTFTFTLTANDGGGAVVSSSYSITVYGTEGDFEKTAASDTPAAASVQLWPQGI
jgi:large repetitive protein